MNISSIIVHAKPTELSSVRGSLEQIPGVEIHAVTDDGRHGFSSIRIRSSEGGLK